MESSSLMPTYQRMPIMFEKGKGLYLYDTNGNRYTDCVSGISVTNLGHNHPEITRAICEQAEQLIHTSNLFIVPQQQALAARLVELTSMTNAFICNSGAEANEAAIKLARLYGHSKKIDSPRIIVMENAFHGRTLATLSASGSRKVQAGFEPLVKGFVRVPFNDINAIKQVAASDSDVVAVLVEPIQGEGGVRTAHPDYLTQLREICDQQDWLLMLDEIQTGNGRTGRYFSFQHTAITPDVLTTAKALGNGVPIGACLAHKAAANLFQPGNHGTTFGGNPLACHTALKVIDVLHQGDYINNAQRIGRLMLDGFRNQLSGTDYIEDIRGQGLMIGIELTQACKELTALAKEKGIIINVTAEKVIRLLPPLIITEAQALEIVEQLSKLIKVYMGDDRKAPRT